MDGHFHEVLRDFALEKMKEIASKELPNIDKRKAIIRKAREATYSESSDDGYSGVKAIDSTKKVCDGKDGKEDSKQREKKSSRRHHHKSSKRDGHHHKSKQKDKKHSSSSSKHKRKHKRKSSRRRKDRRKGDTKEEAEKLSKSGKDSDDRPDMTSIITEKDSESSTEVHTGESDTEGRSVSPPMQLGKDDSSGLLLSDTTQMSPVGLENATISELEEKSLCGSAAGSVVSGEQKQILDGEREQKAQQPVETVDCVPQTSVGECDGNVEERDTASSSKMEVEKKEQIIKQVIEEVEPSGTSEELQKVIEKSLPAERLNQTDFSDLTAKAAQNTEKQSTLPQTEENESGNVASGKEDEEKQGEQDISKETEGAPKVKNRQNVIKIKIKTLELPTDASVTGENNAKREEDDGPNTSEDDDEDDDDGVSENADPNHPWRIVPEEGELSPSSASEEDQEEKYQKVVTVSQKENETGDKSDVTWKDQNKPLRKRRHEEKEDCDIDTDNKKRRRKVDRHEKTSENNDRGNFRKSVKERLGKRETSKSPEKRTVRSSVVVHRNRSPRRHTRHSRSRSRTPRQYRSHSRSPHSSRFSSSRGRHYRSRSRSPMPRRSRSPHRRSHRDRPSDSRDRRREWSRSPSREKRKRRERSYTPVEEIDKKKLFEIAKANAYLYQKVAAGELPANTKFPQLESKTISLAGGKTVDELTEVCKNLSKGDDEDSSDEEPVNVPVVSDEEKDSFIRHPFQVKERPQSIVVNIQNATTLPIQNSKEKLRVQFPVSSGTQHRKKEELTVTGPYGEWQPVKKPEPVSTAQASSNTSTVPTITPTPGGTLPPSSTSSSTTVNPPTVMPTLPAPVVPAPVVLPPPVVQPAPVPVEDRVFEEPPAENVSIADVVAMRLKAARQLQTNPLDVEALSSLHKAQNSLQNWVNKDNKPGLFTGRTDANILTPMQLGHPDRKNQAWAKKDMFHHHLPVRGGIGMQLLQKMGWKQGEGLGRNKEGVTQPLVLDVKMDRKGLAVKSAPKIPVNRLQKMRNNNPHPPQASLDLTGKHPVSILNELCSKRKWKQPDYVTVLDEGPAHKKEFIFKVILNGEEFQGAISCNNKKEAKALAAQTALVKLGLLPNPAQVT